MNIFIVGDAQELSVVYISWLCKKRGAVVIPLTENELGVDWTFEYDDLNPTDGYIIIGGRRIFFAEASGTFVRFNPHPVLPASLQLDPLKEQLFISERRASLHQFLESLPCVVVNRPSAGRSNGSKPFQMRLLANAGFKIPKWIATNKLDAVQEFSTHFANQVIYKSCSGLRSQVRLLDDDVLRKLSDGTTPIVLQEYIPGRDVRIHSVKDVAFATEILSGGIDYRFEHENCIYQPTIAPAALVELCCRFAEAEGLVIAGFDFRVTDNGQWYCLEMNPVPSFLPYEMQTGQPIGSALVDVLTGT